ncbi:MAG: phage tail protein [Haloarculaceae archaeon]
MAAADRTDPYLGYRYTVELDGLLVAGFASVRGLEVRMEPERYMEGGVNDHPHHLPTRSESPPLVLERGVSDSEAFLSWMRGTAPGTVERRDGRVVVLDGTGREVRGYQFRRAYPVRWTGPELSASRDAVAIESLELVHEGLSAMEVESP